MTNSNKNNRVKNAFELYGEKREKQGEEKGLVKGEKKRSQTVYERALKMGFDEKMAHTLAFGD